MSSAPAPGFRWVFAWLALCLYTALGCEGQPRIADRVPEALRNAPPSAANTAITHEGRLLPTAEPEAPSPVASALGQFRATRLRLSPNPTKASRIAFAGSRLGRLKPNELGVYRQPDFAETTYDVPGAQAMAVDNQRRLIVLGESGLHIAGQAKRGRRLARPTFLPGSQLMPDLLKLDHLYVWHRPGDLLIRYALVDTDGRLLPLVEEMKLPDADGRAFIDLADGSFLYTAVDEIVHFFYNGPVRRLKAAFSAPIVRLARARRIDRFWTLGENNALVLWQLGDRLRRVRHLEIDAPVLEIETSQRHLVVLVEVVADGERKLLYRVFDGELNEVAELGLLPPMNYSDADWAERLSRNLGLALSDSPALLAAGGPDWLRVWSLPDSELLFEVSPAARNGAN